MKRKLMISAPSAAIGEKLLEAGADETVFALRGFSQTALSAVSLEEIKGFSSFGLMINRSFYEEDLEQLEKLMRLLENLPVSSIYFCDPAVLFLAGDLKDHLVYKPETLVVSPQDALWWKSQGIGSVSISPLITEEELLEIIRKCPGCEAAVHGHTMMSMSRRRLLSAYREYGNDAFDPESRQLSLREEKRSQHMPVYEDEHGTMIYTDYVQESFDIFAKLLSAGLERAFIDPVFLSEEESLEAVRIYRGMLEGKTMEDEIRSYRNRYGEHLSEGYYGQKTIL